MESLQQVIAQTEQVLDQSQPGSALEAARLAKERLTQAQYEFADLSAGSHSSEVESVDDCLGVISEKLGALLGEMDALTGEKEAFVEYLRSGGALAVATTTSTPATKQASGKTLKAPQQPDAQQPVETLADKVRLNEYDYLTARLFRPNYGAKGFVATSSVYEDPSPVYTLTSVAIDRVVEGETLRVPLGFGDGVLHTIRFETGFRDGRDTIIRENDARGLAVVGEELLQLNEKGKIQPPLSYTEVQAIARVVQTVIRHQQHAK